MPPLFSLLICLLVPAISILLGGILARTWTPRKTTIAAVQHFTAGLILSAVAVELMPDLVASSKFSAIVIGFALGVGTLLTIAKLTEPTETSGSSKNGSAGLIAAVAVDLFVDGLLVGTALTLGARQGLLIALALTIEAFFLAISTSTALACRGAGQVRRFLIIILLSITVITGVLVAHFLSRHLSGNLLAGTLAFATAALLYLVVEELLVEAHRKEDKASTPLFFFAGFLLLYILQYALGG